MAKTTLGAPAPTTASPILPGEITIVIDAEFRTSTWRGTRAQLEAEGLIPADAQWPGTRCWNSVWWEAGGLDYRLTRIRPPDTKGPQRDFAGCDFWSLRIDQPGRSLDPIERKRADLAALEREFSPQGEAETARVFHLHLAARRDAAWLAFCERVPALTAPKRKGRPPKARSATQDSTRPGNIEETQP